MRSALKPEITPLQRRRGLQRNLACALAPIFLLTSCTTNGRVSTSSAGQLHNDGVQYVLARLEPNASGDRMRSRIATLTSDYCRTIRRTCTAPISVPSLPPSTDQIVESASGTGAFKARLRSLFGTLRGARTLREFERSIAAYESPAAGLNRAESLRFADIVSVARFSARYWAPTAEGGLGGGTRPGGGGGGIAARTDWVLVAAADIAGCTENLLNCVEAAIIYSVAEYKRQEMSGR